MYIGDYFEWTGSTSTMKKCYYAAGRRVALRVGSETPQLLLSDHLGSTAVTADILTGAKIADAHYKPFGENWYESTPPMQTSYRYTGQRLEQQLGLYDYGARFYDPALGRFIQADTIVPSPSAPQSLNRYSYVQNRALLYTDPTGHRECGAACDWELYDAPDPNRPLYPPYAVAGGGCLGSSNRYHNAVQAWAIANGVAAVANVPIPGASEKHPGDPAYSGCADLVTWDLGYYEVTTERQWEIDYFHEKKLLQSKRYNVGPYHPAVPLLPATFDGTPYGVPDTIFTVDSHGEDGMIYYSYSQRQLQPDPVPVFDPAPRDVREREDEQQRQDAFRLDLQPVRGYSFGSPPPYWWVPPTVVFLFGGGMLLREWVPAFR